MSSILCSQGVVLATAMAVSGTVLLLALRHQKTLQFPIDQITGSSRQVLRSCISPEGKKKRKKKKVHFAEDVVDPRGDGEEFRRQHGPSVGVRQSSSSTTKFKKNGGHDAKGIRGMPANRVALYNGIIRDRGVYRLAYSC